MSKIDKIYLIYGDDVVINVFTTKKEANDRFEYLIMQKWCRSAYDPFPEEYIIEEWDITTQESKEIRAT